MNLFAEETKVLLLKHIREDWADLLSNFISSEEFLEIGRKVSMARKSGIVYPDKEDVFKVFKYPFDKVKVVIIGQDPYHNGNADGLAFSCKKSLSPSLTKILQGIWRDEMQSINMPLVSTSVNIYIANKHNHNLTYLAEQGVLLLNPTLTVAAASPGSHKGVWKDFTKAVYEALMTKSDLVWMLWGTDAKESVKTRNPNHLYLEAIHPAAAAYQKIAWENNKCFINCNAYLKSKELTEIEWLQR